MGPLTTETFLRARLSAGFSTITSNSHNHPGEECYHCQRPNPTEEEPGAPSAVHVLLEYGGAGTLGGRETRPHALGAQPPPLTPRAGRLTGNRQTPTSPQGGAPDGHESPLLGSALWPAGGAAPGECPERCNPPDCQLYGGHVTERQEVINLDSVFLMRKSFRNPSSCVTIITRVLPLGTPNQKQATSQLLSSSMAHSPSPYTLGP